MWEVNQYNLVDKNKQLGYLLVYIDCLARKV